MACLSPQEVALRPRTTLANQEKDAHYHHLIIPAFSHGILTTPSSPSLTQTHTHIQTHTHRPHVLLLFTLICLPADSEESQTGEDTLPETDILSEAPSHTHKYIVQVELLHRTWAVSEAEANFIQTLRHAEKNDMRGACSARSHAHSQPIRFSPIYYHAPDSL